MTEAHQQQETNPVEQECNCKWKEMNYIISQRNRKKGNNNGGCVWLTDSEHQAYILTNGLTYTQICKISNI